MFTDIEGSTRLLAALGDQYADVLADHRRLVRTVVAAAGGVEVDTQGDAFLVAFSDAGHALTAAIGVQRSMAGHPWPQAVSVLVRIGLHTGTPTRAGDGYIGLDLHRGARICASGRGGQVVLSDRTRAALGTLDIGPAALRPLGVHQLKDLDEPLVLFEVRADGMGGSAHRDDSEARVALPDTPSSAPTRPRRRPAVLVFTVVLLSAFIVIVTTRGLAEGVASGVGERVRNGTAQGAVRGGTLNMLGAGDVDYLDPNITYYSAGYAVARLYSRQLFTNPADPATSTTAVPDLAEAIPTVDNGGISPDGKTYTITIKQGAQWNTSRPRQVTAADVVIGIKRTCNPAQPFGGVSDYQNLIVGFGQFCSQFTKIARDARSMKKFIQVTPLAGVVAVDDRTVVFTLNSPATYFVDMLTLPALSPAPVELLDHVPGSVETGQHMISDGPYQVDLYEPDKRIELSRNPAWNAASDPVRGAFVDKVVIDETLTPEIVQQLLQAGSPGADLAFDVTTPAYQVATLLAAKDPQLLIGPAGSSISYMAYNFMSPNNDGALADVRIRRAISYAINRAAIIPVLGGPEVSPPLTHVLPPGILGSEDFDLYPYDPDKAKQLLAESGFPHGLTLKILYRTGFEGSGKTLASVRQDLEKIGISVEAVPSSDADFYVRYLQVPDVAARGVWDLAVGSWNTDWYGDAAISFFNPLFSGSSSFPPMGSNYGFYNSEEANALIKEAGSAADQHAAIAAWSKADHQVMADAAFYPIANPRWATYRAAHVHNAVYLDALQSFDPANVWLSPDRNGG